METAGINIFAVGIIQISSAVFILFMLYVLTKSMKGLASNWLQGEALYEESYILSSYETVIGYNDAKEKKRSIIWTAPFLVGAVPAFYFGKTWMGCHSKVSDFNPNVINACTGQAQAAGYGLQVTNCIYDVNNNIQTAEVVLTYSYNIPLFGISETKTTRGIAR